MRNRKIVKLTDYNKARDFVKKEFAIRMRRIKYGGSSALCEESIIEIDMAECDSVFKMWSLVFHEVSHILCYREGLWTKYHDETWGTEEEVSQYVRRNWLRAERFVDKKGKKLMKKYFPKMKYEPTYQRPEDIAWMRKYLDKYYSKI